MKEKKKKKEKKENELWMCVPFLCVIVSMIMVAGIAFTLDSEPNTQGYEENTTSIPRSFTTEADVKNPSYNEPLDIFSVATSVDADGISFKMRLTDNIPNANLSTKGSTIMHFAPVNFDMDLFDWSVELSRERGSSYTISAIDEYGVDGFDRLNIAVAYDEWAHDIPFGDLFTLTLTPKKQVPKNTAIEAFGDNGKCTISTDTFNVSTLRIP